MLVQDDIFEDSKRLCRSKREMTRIDEWFPLHRVPGQPFNPPWLPLPLRSIGYANRRTLTWNTG